jgi:hypothetical protein
MSLALAANGIQAQDGTGEYHEETVVAGGLNGSGAQVQGSDAILSKNLIQEKMKAGQELIIGQVKIQAQENNRLRISSNGNFADTNLSLFQAENQVLKAVLSNGQNAEVKIMPNTASETALQRLRLKVCNESNNCTIQLKEVTQNKNQTRLAYEVKAEKQSRVLGLFKTKMQVQSQVDAETGEVISANKPWWAFLASESEE